MENVSPTNSGGSRLNQVRTRRNGQSRDGGNCSPGFTGQNVAECHPRQQDSVIPLV
jgi:hypothetical protein